MVAHILTKLKNKYSNVRGFHTDRHLLIIESDDWGSIRMPSLDTFRHLQKLGDCPEKDGFLANDSLESVNDLNDLYEVLSSVRDINGNPAVITANFAMANPDFNNIDINSGKYAYEPFYETYEKYRPGENVLALIENGISERVFFPQLHCREHMNVNRWMHSLKNKQEDAILAFENQMIGVGKSFTATNKYGYMDAFNTDMTTSREMKEIIDDAVEIFERTFGYKSKTFVASCFVWAEELENILSYYGVDGIQSSFWQNYPVTQNGQSAYKRRIHFTGQKNKNGQIYTIRNCNYEPAYLQNAEQCFESCLEEICSSFKNRKPAIINSHRFNYISSINPNNGKNNIKWLKNLLLNIKEAYPDVEFITTTDLIDIIRQEAK